MSGLPAAPARASRSPGPRWSRSTLRRPRHPGVSFLVDAALITVVDVVMGVGAALILSVLHLPHELRTILAVIGAVAFVARVDRSTSWSSGPRPARRPVPRMHADPRGERRRGPRQARGGSVVRCIGVVLAALPLFAGFVPILFDRRRRGFQDWLARTAGRRSAGPSIAEVSRAKKRAIREASRQPPPAVPQ